MALKFAELEWMRDQLGEYPLFLLDEVVAELDSGRRQYLLDRLDGKAQTLLTTTELDIFDAAFPREGATVPSRKWSDSSARPLSWLLALNDRSMASY